MNIAQVCSLESILSAKDIRNLLFFGERLLKICEFGVDLLPSREITSYLFLLWELFGDRLLLRELHEDFLCLQDESRDLRGNFLRLRDDSGDLDIFLRLEKYVYLKNNSSRCWLF